MRLDYKGGKPSRKQKPIVKFKPDNPHGELVYEFENRRHDNDFQFNQPIDKYYKNEAVNKLIFEVRQEQKRYQQINKLVPVEETKTFDEYYKKQKVTKIKPLLEKDRKLFEKRAAQFERRQGRIAKFREDPNSLRKDDNNFNGRNYLS